MTAARETNAQMIKRLRADAEARGDCYECRARPAKGLVGDRYVKRCQTCLDRNNRKKYRLCTTKGRCRECGRKLYSRCRFKRCKACRERTRSRVRRREQRRIEAGLCCLCGEPRDPKSKRWCTKHKEQNRVRIAERAARGRLAEIGMAP